MARAGSQQHPAPGTVPAAPLPRLGVTEPHARREARQGGAAAAPSRAATPPGESHPRRPRRSPRGAQPRPRAVIGGRCRGVGGGTAAARPGPAPSRPSPAGRRSRAGLRGPAASWSPEEEAGARGGGGGGLRVGLPPWPPSSRRRLWTVSGARGRQRPGESPAAPLAARGATAPGPRTVPVGELVLAWAQGGGSGSPGVVAVPAGRPWALCPGGAGARRRGGGHGPRGVTHRRRSGQAGRRRESPGRAGSAPRGSEVGDSRGAGPWGAAGPERGVVGAGPW